MARGEMVVKVALVAVFYSIVVATPRVVEAAVTCDLVISDLAPCATYLTSGGQVPSDCCKGVKSLNDAATTTADRQAFCTCAEQTITSLPGIKLDNVRSLPKKCGVNFPYDLAPGTDCSKYVPFF